MRKLSYNVTMSSSPASFLPAPSFLRLPHSLLLLLTFMPSYASLPLPRSPRLPPLSLLSFPFPSPPLSDSKLPPPHSSFTEPPARNQITTFVSTLLNLTKRPFPASHTPTFPSLHSPSSLYPSLMKSLSLSGRPDLSLLLFFSLPSPPSPRLLSSFLHSLSQLKQPHLLQSVLPSLLSSSDLTFSPTSFTILSNFLSNSPDYAHCTFQLIKNPDEIAFGAYIAVLCKSGRIEEALGVFDQMLERGVQPTARTCTCILKAYCQEGRVKEAQRFLCTMENGIGDGMLPRPDVIMYTVYIEGLCLVCEFDLVEQVMTSGTVSM